MSDMWAAYAHIQDINNGIYMHAQVNHSHHFVHPIDPDVHTQNVEHVDAGKKNIVKAIRNIAWIISFVSGQIHIS